MPSIKPRFNVVFDSMDAECIRLLARKKEMSASQLIRKFTQEALEEYEDEMLAKRADEAYEEWVKGGKKTISHEEVWKTLDIK
jgi:predicted DNA-binding protein